MNATRVRHIENLLTQYDQLAASSLKFPFDTFSWRYFAANKSLNAADRRWITEKGADVIRWRLLVEHCTPPPSSAWSNRLKTYFLSHRWKLNSKNKSLPDHVRCSFPEPLYNRYVKSLGKSQALQTCFVLNEAAPQFLRVNVNRTSRDKVYKYLLAKGAAVEKTLYSPIGLILCSPVELNTLPEFRRGLIELQDESSQLMGLNVAAEPGETVLDFCAGSGGKSLVFGPLLENRGALVLHDPSEQRLARASRRLRAAGVDNRRVAAAAADLAPLVGRCDWVVCDVPCSGSGSLRRSPHVKWLYSDDWFQNLLQQQAEIVAAAVPFLRKNSKARGKRGKCGNAPTAAASNGFGDGDDDGSSSGCSSAGGGKLVYMTQSVFEEENNEMVRAICRRHNLRLVEPPTSSLPLSGGLDGYFCAIMQQAPAKPVELGPGTKSARPESGYQRKEGLHQVREETARAPKNGQSKNSTCEPGTTTAKISDVTPRNIVKNKSDTITAGTMIDITNLDAVAETHSKPDSVDDFHSTEKATPEDLAGSDTLKPQADIRPALDDIEFIGFD